MIEKVKLYLDESTGKFSKTENVGAPFIMAEQEVEIEKQRVAFIDVSGSMTGKKLQLAIVAAKKMYIKKYALFSDKLLTGIGDIDNLSPDDSCVSFHGATKIQWLENIEDWVEPILFTDGDFYENREYVGELLLRKKALLQLIF